MTINTTAMTWPPTPLQPLANARLLLRQTRIPGATTSQVVAFHVLECFWSRERYISAKENGPGVETGEFTDQGTICRASRLPALPGPSWPMAAPLWRPARVRSGWETSGC